MDSDTEADLRRKLAQALRDLDEAARALDHMTHKWLEAKEAKK